MAGVVGSVLVITILENYFSKLTLAQFAMNERKEI
jgi:hypothetical protein